VGLYGIIVCVPIFGSLFGLIGLFKDMEEILQALAQYGPLGLWTASLLWMNWQMRKDQKIADKEAKEAIQYHQEHIATALLEQKMLLEKGLEAMREKYAEDRLLRMKDK
jgi:uncharacterized membrane protein